MGKATVASTLGSSLLNTGCAGMGYSIVVFRDQNNDGIIDPYGYEPDRIPNVRVMAEGTEGITDSTGHAILSLSPGKHTMTVDQKTLPPYFSASPRQIETPENMAQDILFPVELKIGGNSHDIYMGFGDSITAGNGDASYLDLLQQKMKGYFGIAVMENAGKNGTERTSDGTARIADAMYGGVPSYVLLLDGANDWTEQSCKTTFVGNGTLDGCHTLDNLNYMIDAIIGNESLPVLGTIPPINVGYDQRMNSGVNRTSPERQRWVEMTNDRIRQLAVNKGVVLADVYKTITDSPGYKTDPASVFKDHMNPNELGRELIANAFFNAITKRPEWRLYTD